MRDILLDGLVYDRWANLRWVPVLVRFADRAQAEKTFIHILDAQARWLARCGVGAFEDYVRPTLEERIEALNAAFQDFVLHVDLELVIPITAMDGTHYDARVGQIALHVINHGTYHRGQLRGQAAAEGLDEFPETDYIRFVRESSSDTLHA